jgi:hypothetical protein
VNAEWAEVFKFGVLLAVYLLTGWFARGWYDAPARRALERALESARLELRALTAHTMARHKARSEAAVRGHATRRAASAVAAAQPTIGSEVRP